MTASIQPSCYRHDILIQVFPMMNNGGCCISCWGIIVVEMSSVVSSMSRVIILLSRLATGTGLGPTFHGCGSLLQSTCTSCWPMTAFYPHCNSCSWWDSSAVDRGAGRDTIAAALEKPPLTTRFLPPKPPNAQNIHSLLGSPPSPPGMASSAFG